MKKKSVYTPSVRSEKIKVKPFSLPVFNFSYSRHLLNPRLREKNRRQYTRNPRYGGFYAGILAGTLSRRR